MTARSTLAGARTLTIAACAATLVAFEWLFRPYFPDASGALPSAYAYSFPRLYDGALWFHANGPFAVPWFTPSFCGGIPAYANPRNDYFALPQLLDLAVGPVAAVHATAIVFAGLGFLGFYLLVRGAFGGGRGAAVFAGGLFALNGLSLWRLAAGELPVHAFLLTPLVAWGALVPTPPERRGAVLARDTCVAGGAVGYAVHAGALHVVPLMALSVAAIGLVHCIANGAGAREANELVARFLGVFVAGFALAAGKLAAIVSFLAHAPAARPSPAALAHGASDVVPLLLDAGPVPLVILAVAALVAPAVLALRVHRGLAPGVGVAIARGFAWAGVLALFLGIPIALRAYEPALAPTFDALPILRHARSLFPLVPVVVPVTILASALVVDRLIHRYAQGLVAVAAVALLVLDHHGHLRDAVADYSPEPIARAHKELAENHFVPPIQLVDPAVLHPGPALPLGQTAAGVSTYPCDEPRFRDLATSLPKAELHDGPVTDVTARAYNLFDPACFLFPSENGCAPGDRMSVEKKERFERFRAHAAITFVKPGWQRLADATSFVTLAAMLLGWMLGEKGRRA